MKTEDYLRIPYKEKGRGWDGADCYGFARIIIERETGFIMPLLDGRTEARTSDFSLYERLDEPEELSLVFLQGGPFRKAHVAVYTDGALLHMSEKGPCCQDARRLKRFIKGVYKPKECTLHSV